MHWYFIVLCAPYKIGVMLYFDSIFLCLSLGFWLMVCLVWTCSIWILLCVNLFQSVVSTCLCVSAACNRCFGFSVGHSQFPFVFSLMNSKSATSLVGGFWIRFSYWAKNWIQNPPFGGVYKLNWCSLQYGQTDSVGIIFLFCCRGHGCWSSLHWSCMWVTWMSFCIVIAAATFWIACFFGSLLGGKQLGCHPI